MAQRKKRDRERELLEKRFEDRSREVKRLAGELEEARRGVSQLGAAVNGLLTAVVLEYGTGTEEKRLCLSRFDLDRLRRSYEIHACREKEDYVLTVRERGNVDGSGGKKTEV